MRQFSPTHNAWLAQWREDLLRGSKNDPLIDLKSSSEKWLEMGLIDDLPVVFPLDTKIKKLIAEQQELMKNAGVNVLCVIREVLHWQEGSSTYETPIFLSEAQIQIDKIQQTVTCTVGEEQFVNPFLEKTFASKFDQNLISWLERNVLPETWTRHSVSLLGNFHYHRFALLRDFDAYEDSELLMSTPLAIYLQEKSLDNLHFQKPLDAIFPMDADQNNVLKRLIAGNHLVVEGPPGSGKSQVLSNALFHAAKNQQRVLLCSEKRTALQVVASKLESQGLGLFCQNLTSVSQGKTEFVRSLQSTWTTLEKYAAKSQQQILPPNYFTQKREALALKLERLSSFPKLSSTPVRPPYELSFYPDIPDFERYKAQVFHLNQKYVLHANQALNHCVFVFLKPFVLSTSQTLSQFLNLVNQNREKLMNCKTVFGVTLSISKAVDFEHVQRTLIHAQILSQPLFRKNPDLFVENSPTFKKFHSAYQKYLVSKQTLDLHNKQEGFKWQNPWSRQELLAAKKSFKEDRFWNSDFRNWKKKFILSYQPEVFTRDLAINAIDSCLGVHDIMLQHQKCIEVFQKFGIQHPEVDLPIVFQLQRNVNQDVVGLKQTRENFDPEFLDLLLSQQSDLQDLNRFIQHHFANLKNWDVIQLFDKIIEDANFMIGQRDLLLKILKEEPQLPVFLPEIQDFGVLENVIVWGAIQKFKNRNPELYHYSAADLMQDIDHLILEENHFFQTQIDEFFQSRIRQFVRFHSLISDSSTKLSEEDKVLRKVLKSGRSLLIKEFNKTRQHKSIRELLSSDAAPWIHLLKPILLLNPLTIAQVLPNVSSSIDVLLFDEASQIPFSHAIPAIFRAKQIAIFGDSQQLSPSAYFLQGSSQRADLLSESRHFLPCEQLNFHYRSRHESLIAFSNRYFYHNRLKVMPALTNASRDGVFCHYVENATYSSGENYSEALALIQQLKSDFTTISKDASIGIVAFSEKQISVIEKILADKEAKDLQRAFDQERFFLTTIEKVQGDEFDVLYISLAYGKDAEGNFALRFGPVNQDGGDKRLNVLFTRARSSLHFFHSVRAHDFGHSENPGVQALKNFLMMHENREKSLNATVQNELEIVDPFYDHDAVVNLMTLKRHADWSGLNMKLKFLKDEAVTKSKIQE